MNRYFKIILSFLFIVLLQSCATTSKKPQSVHGDKPLIDTAKIIIEGREDMDKKVREGPKPYDTEITARAEKRMKKSGDRKKKIDLKGKKLNGI